MSLKRKADHLEEDNNDCEYGVIPLKRPRRSPLSPSLRQQSLKLPRREPSQHSVAFQKPSIVTTFSYTPDRELAFDNSAMKYFVQPPVRADLGYRYSGWTKRPEEKGRLDHLLRAVARSGVTQSPFEGAVSWRGVMCKYATLFDAHV
jgi:RAT1-interacting protein